MPNPDWFNYTTYMANKLASLQAADPDAGWTPTKVAEAFSNAGFGGVEGAYAHFNQYGNTAAENLSPNDLFVPEQYYKFKAKDYFGHDSVSQVTAQEAGFIEDAIAQAGMSAWQHYIDYGTKEGINPSNSFDTQKYLEAKAAALNAAGGSTTWTAETVADAFKAANLNALSHAILFSGKGDNEAASVFDDNGAVVDAYKVDDKISGDDDGTTFTLTTGRDTVTGTNGDDVIEAPEIGGDATLTGGDNIDGGAGKDTINVYKGNFTGVTMQNVEVVNDYVRATTDLTTLDGVTNYNYMTDLQGVTVKANLSTEVGFKGAQTNNVVVNFSGASGTTDAASIALTDVTTTTVQNASAVNAGDGGVETLTLNLAGTNKLGDTANAGQVIASGMTKLIVTGEGSLSSAKSGTNVQLVGKAGFNEIEASGAQGDLNMALANNATALTTFAYSGSQGKDNFDLSTAGQIANTTKLTIDLGAEADTLAIGMLPAAAGTTVSGGAGTDTLKLVNVDVITANPSAAQKAMFTDFETLTLAADSTTAGALATYKVGTFSGITDFNIETSGTNGSTANVTEMASGGTVKVKALDTGTDTVSLQLNTDAAAVAGSSVGVQLDNGKTAATGADNGSVISTFSTNAKVLNIESNGTVNTLVHNGLSLGTASTVQNIHIQGDQALDVSTGANTTISIIDASDLSAKLTLNAAGVTTGDNTLANPLTVTGGSKGDAVTLAGGLVGKKIVLKAGSSLVADHDGYAGVDADDFIDIKAFFTGTEAGSKALTESTDVTFAGGTANASAAQALAVTVAADKATNFFKNATDTFHTAWVTNNSDSAVFVDTDGNGNWDAGTDLVVVLQGVTLNGATIASGLVDLA